MSREDYEKLMDEFRQVVAGTKFENCVEFDICDDFFTAVMDMKDGNQ